MSVCEACNGYNDGQFELHGLWFELCGACARALRDALFTDETLAQAKNGVCAAYVGAQVNVAVLNLNATVQFAEATDEASSKEALKKAMLETINEIALCEIKAQADLYNAIKTWCAERKKEPAT